VTDFASSDEFYSFVDLLAQRLSEEGLPEQGRKIHFLLHEVAWTTSSELIGELGAVLLAVQREAEPHLPADVLEALARSLRAVRRVWPELR
jgi:hypothetical protein